MTHNTREELRQRILEEMNAGRVNNKTYIDCEWLLSQYDSTLHHQLQKAREEERERIEAIFKEHVPPHAMDLEDSVWLKRLLNKAFNHDKNI